MATPHSNLPILKYVVLKKFRTRMRVQKFYKLGGAKKMPDLLNSVACFSLELRTRRTQWLHMYIHAPDLGINAHPGPSAVRAELELERAERVSGMG